MSIHLEATYPVAPERVYELLTNGEKFGAATGKAAQLGEGEGVSFSLFDAWVEGRTIELVPNQRVVQAWRFKQWDPGTYSIVRFTLTAEGSGTRFVIDHDAYPSHYHDHITTNYPNFYLDPMAKYFGG